MDGFVPGAGPVEDLPIVLRPAVRHSPLRGSIFEDPGDEKSWRISQLRRSLSHHFKDRSPSWYSRAIRDLQGADRVLDLGCGPGLTLEALREQGSTRVLGIDRWLQFVQESGRRSNPILAHDLTLPMPFLESGSFDAVFSHYALEYLSPIGMRQVLRESHRLLSVGGRILIYLSGVGLGGGDPARTVPYSAAAMERLLHEAGFEEIEVKAPGDERNTVAKARRPSAGLDARDSFQGDIRVALARETQTSAAFVGSGERLELELNGEGRRMLLAFELPAGTDERTSICIRLLTRSARSSELQVWAWRDTAPVVGECVALEFPPTSLRIGCAGRIEHRSVWAPEDLVLEPTGDACARPGDLPSGIDLSEVERGSEGRKLVVEGRHEGGLDVARLHGGARNRCLVVRARDLDVARADEQWLGGWLHGIAFGAEELDQPAALGPFAWAQWRKALVVVDGAGWARVAAAVSARLQDLGGPLVLVDPVLDDTRATSGLPDDVIELIAAAPTAFAVLAWSSRSRLSGRQLAQLRGRLLHGGPVGDDPGAMLEASETLRHLTEWLSLTWLRRIRPRSWAEVGRRPPLR